MQDNFSIFFLATRPVSERDYKRFGIEILKENGLRIKFLECSYIFRYKHYLKCGGDGANFNFKELQIVKNYKQLKDLIIKEKPSICVNVLGSTLKENIFLNFVSKNSNLLKLNIGTYPLYNHSFINYLLKFLSQHSFLFILKYLIFFNFNNYLSKNIKYKYVALSGQKSSKFIESKKITDTYYIDGHTFDYDIYLNFVSQKKSVQENFVFLDKGWATHPDLHFNKIKNNVDYEEYYLNLNTFLKSLSKKINLKPKILTHPKSDSNYVKKFTDIEVFNNNTVEHIYNSNLVFSYSSVAISYAVLFKKPIIIYSYNLKGFSYFQNKFYYNEDKAFAIDLGLKHILINQFQNSYLNIDIPKIDYNKYDQYKKNYIKIPESPEKNLWKIILENIKNNF